MKSNTFGRMSTALVGLAAVAGLLWALVPVFVELGNVFRVLTDALRVAA